MSKPEVNLKPTEMAIVQSAAQLYAAYVTAGRVEEGKETEWMERALKDVMKFARAVEGVADTDSGTETQAPSAAEAAPAKQAPPADPGGSAPHKVEPGQAGEPLPMKEELEDMSTEVERKAADAEPGPRPDDESYRPGVDRIVLDDEMDEPGSGISRQSKKENG